MGVYFLFSSPKSTLGGWFTLPLRLLHILYISLYFLSFRIYTPWRVSHPPKVTVVSHYYWYIKAIYNIGTEILFSCCFDNNSPSIQTTLGVIKPNIHHFSRGIFLDRSRALKNCILTFFLTDSEYSPGHFKHTLKKTTKKHFLRICCRRRHLLGG